MRAYLPTYLPTVAVLCAPFRPLWVSRGGSWQRRLTRSLTHQSLNQSINQSIHPPPHSFLHFEDFPPNPSRGLEVPPAVIGLRPAASPRQQQGTARLATEGLLVDVALPDFSMPFNVITLCSTLVAFFFGSMLNVVVRKGRRTGEGERKGKRVRGGAGGSGGIGRVRDKVWALWVRLSGRSNEE